MDVRFLTIGDNAVSVEFGNDISVETNLKVNSLHRELHDNPIVGIAEMVPTFRSLMVQYRPEQIRFCELCGKIEERFTRMGSVALPPQQVWDIPVWYGGDFGIDMDLLAQYHNTTPERIIEMHSGPEYLIYMLGFAAGMAYSAAEKSEITIPRRQTPRVSVGEGCIIIQQNQTIINPFTAPSGWHIVGITPVKVFDAKREGPFMLKAGQWMKFFPIGKEEFYKIKEQAAAGTYRCNLRDKEAAK